MKNKVRLCLLLAGFLATAATAETRCVSLEYPPLVEGTASGEVKGFASDLVRTLFRRMGLPVQIALYPWARSLSMAFSGTADCIFTLYRNDERTRLLDYGRIPLFPQTVYLYARKETVVDFDGNLSSIRRLSIGTAHSVNYGPKFESARSTLRIDQSPSIETNFLKLAMGRVDLVPSDAAIATATLTSRPLRKYAADIVRLPLPLESIPSYIAFSKSRHLTALRDRFDAELAAYIASGEYAALLARYGIEPTPLSAGMTIRQPRLRACR